MRLATQIALLMHTREYKKAVSAGPLLLSALEHATLFEYGKRDSPLDLRHLGKAERKILILTDAEGARPLSEMDRGSPVILLVPDGTARQIARGYRRIPGLEEAERVCLPPDDLRLASSESSASHTFFRVARALAYLEKSVNAEIYLRNTLERVEQARYSANHRDEPLTQPIGSEVTSDGTVALEQPLELLYRDEFLIAVNKPSGIPVHKGWSDAARPVLQRLRDQVGQRVYPVHRLDQATSGVLLFALSGELARELQTLFENNEIHKCYLAVCRGNNLAPQTLNHPLLASDGQTRKSAVTTFRILSTFERYALIEAVPQTGRTHQIRRHLKHLSHPIIGDVRYGKGDHNRLFRERFGFHRLALHCRSLEFTHPRTRLKLKILAAPKKSLAELFHQLGWAHHI